MCRHVLTALCLLYYHPERFAESYGEDDLPELDKSLQNAFEAVGEVALVLKEKTSEGRAPIDLQGSGLPDLASSADVDGASD